MFFKLYKQLPLQVSKGINTPSKVNIVEVGPRDGLQNLKKILTLDQRLLFIEKIHACNIHDIEVGSMSNPRYVPQMEHSHSLLSHTRHFKPQGANYSILVPNSIGFDNLIKSSGINYADEVLFNVSTSETFNKKNLGRSIDQTLNDIDNDLVKAKNLKIKTRLSISTVWGCPFEKDSKNLNKILEYCTTRQFDKIDLADTISCAKPNDVFNTFEKAFRLLPNVKFAGHFHNKDDIGMKNAEAAMLAGVDILHSSILGIGGCPSVPKMYGNIDTLELVNLLESKNIQHDVNIEKLIETRDWLKSILI